MKDVRIEAGWKKVLQEEFDKFYGSSEILCDDLIVEREKS